MTSIAEKLRAALPVKQVGTGRHGDRIMDADFAAIERERREAAEEIDRLIKEIADARHEASCCDDIRLDQSLAGIISDLQRVRSASEAEVERLTRERDEAKAEVARYWTSADMKPWCDLAEKKGLGHFGKKLKGMFSRAMAAEESSRVEFARAESAEALLAEAVEAAKTAEAKIVGMYRAITPHANYDNELTINGHCSGNRFADDDSNVHALRAFLAKVKPALQTGGESDV